MKRKKSSSIESSVYKGLNFKKLSIEFDELLKKVTKEDFEKWELMENLRGNQMERIGTFCDKCRLPSCICNNEIHKEFIIKWIARRIKDEQRKHESFQINWHEIAARKLYATYNITFKPNIKVDECEYCSDFECNKKCEKDYE